MISSVPLLFVFCSIPFTAPAHAVVPKTGGTYIISDDLAAGTGGSVDLAGGSIVLSGSLGQVAIAYADSSGIEVESGYFSKYVSTPATAGYGAVYQTSATITAAEATVPNPSATVYEVEVSTASDFSLATVYASTTAWPAAVSGLANGTTYYTRLRAVYMGEDPSPYALLASFVTLMLPPVPGQPSQPTALVLGVSSIAWNWSALSGATGYEVYLATAPGLVVDSPVMPAYIREGLTPNTTYSIMAAGVNGSGAGAVSLAAVPAATLANPPAGVSTAAVYATSATVTWGLNGNPDGTMARMLRRLPGVETGATFTTAGTSYTDTGLLGCTTYDFLIWNVNRAGVDTANASVLSVLTGSPVPLTPGNFTAQSLSGYRIALAWEPPPYEGITGYNLYYDNGTSTVSYTAPLDTLPAGQLSYTAAMPGVGNYKFGLRAIHRCGIEDPNTRIVASAPSLYSLTGVKAAIKIPQSGKRINGNSVTVMAELVLGTEADTRDIRFEYKISTAPDSAWAAIPPKNAATHPNPDPASPYFILWNVDGLAQTSYDLRAVAADRGGLADASPAAITVDITDQNNADIKENASGNTVTKEQDVSSLVDNTIQTGDGDSQQMTTLLIPANALDTSTAAVSVTNNPDVTLVPPADAQSAGVVTEISLSNGQTQLANGRTADVTLVYSDVDNDGIVDGTTLLANQLVMYSAESPNGPWSSDLSSEVDATNNKVHGHTTHFSFFALFAPMSADLNSAKAYPVPWKPGSGGRFDSPTGVTGMVFDNLTATAEIRIYTIAGGLVRKLDVTAADGGYKVWDGKNSSGSKAASGIYLAHIKSGSKVKILKLAIER